MTKTRAIRTLTLGGAATAAATLLIAAPAAAETEVPEPSSFTSAFTVMATPDQVIGSDGQAAPGEPGATGTFDFRIDSDTEVICYDITLSGVTGDYQSPAKTATHIHEAAAGEAGPPRIAFPDPVDQGDGTRTSSGCLQGPFTTGVTNDAGADTGEGFTLAQIEADPAAFTGDSHTASFVPGVVRGQLAQVPVGGVATGAGGAAQSGPDAGLALGAGALGLTAAGAAAWIVARRRAAQES
ncbi:CHRD domain-containing protein [Frigoribacterium salinisoli]